MEQDIELCALFHGRVQGVFFRATVERHANNSRIVGYVENLDDGSVRLIAQGKKTDLEKLLATLKAHPGEADITRIDVSYGPIGQACKDFKVKR